TDLQRWPTFAQVYPILFHGRWCAPAHELLLANARNTGNPRARAPDPAPRTPARGCPYYTRMSLSSRSLGNRVILSATKDLTRWATRSFANAQDGKGKDDSFMSLPIPTPWATIKAHLAMPHTTRPYG
ncbi:MAG: hypothetical protein ACXWOL_15190, partial [Ktedonobacteraceae bacterium]